VANSELTGLLLAGALHEIKNRFGTLYNQLDQLIAHLPENFARQQVNLIKAEADFISNELIRVLAGYKTLNEQLTADVDQVFIDEFLNDIRVRHAHAQAAYELKLEVNCDEDTCGFFDRNLLTVVFDTLIYNAIQAGARRIRLSASDADPRWLNLLIEDDGPGFPDDFAQGGWQTHPGQLHGSHTGLGLYVANRLIAAHAEGDWCGQMELGRSPKLKGAAVTLKLPQ
jgi:signal transduction histidine kinase